MPVAISTIHPSWKMRCLEQHLEIDRKGLPTLSKEGNSQGNQDWSLFLLTRRGRSCLSGSDGEALL